MIQNHRGKTELRPQERNDFQLRQQAIGMSQGDVTRCLFPMHRNVAHLDLQMKRDNVEAANLRAASGNALDFLDDAAAHVGLEGIGGGVPEARQHCDHAGAGGNQQIFPPASRPGGGFAHRDCTPSPAAVIAPGTLTLLSERRDCSQEIISSLTLSSVSNSRIWAATSAGGVSVTTGCFNCGTNFSR